MLGLKSKSCEADLFGNRRHSLISICSRISTGLRMHCRNIVAQKRLHGAVRTRMLYGRSRFVLYFSPD